MELSKDLEKDPNYIMSIKINKLSKKFKQDWIVRDLDYEFFLGSSYAIKGQNGSGKSTLLQMISGYLSPTKGKIVYTLGKNIDRDDIYKYLSFAAPYTGLLEEFSCWEQILFHGKFKNFRNGYQAKEIAELLQFENKNLHKKIAYFSSGMKQRLKIGLAILTEAPILLLDEPTITLDKNAVLWYRNLLESEVKNTNQISIIASNEEEDFVLCEDFLHLEQYK
jgi:ABC-type multidrug transport system ATPase subunit